MQRMSAVCKGVSETLLSLIKLFSKYSVEYGHCFLILQVLNELLENRFWFPYIFLILQGLKICDSIICQNL